MRGSSILFAITSTGLLRLAEDLRDLLVPGRDPDLGVDDEEDEVRLGDRLARLDGDRARDRRLVGDVDAAGVDQEEALAGPLDDELLAVARDAGRLVDDRLAGAAQPVDERRLADVREADDRDGAEQRRRRSRLGGEVVVVRLLVGGVVQKVVSCLVVGHGG